MTTTEFKIKYPHYKNLEGNDLWDKMTMVLLQEGNTLYADPNQIKKYLKPIVINTFQDDGNYAIQHIALEDSSTTKWLNSKGELQRIGEEIKDKEKLTNTSYSMVIWDVSLWNSNNGKSI